MEPRGRRGRWGSGRHAAGGRAYAARIGGGRPGGSRVAAGTERGTLEDLAQSLRRLEGAPYPAYKDLAGRWRAGGFVLCLDHVQGDPFASPSRLRVLVEGGMAGLPEWTRSSRGRRVTAADFLLRRFRDVLQGASGWRGSGKSGRLEVVLPGQEVLERTAVLVREGGAVEARFRAGLPARGRRILGGEAQAMLCRAVPAAVEAGLRFASLDEAAMRRHVEAVEDAQALRASLEERGLVAFVADGAILPRRSGVDDRPLEGPRAVPFASPESLRVTLEAPNAGPIRGMGIPRGVTLITGGGYHGKSTLLRAIERGVYDHVPGDGRERVVAVADAVKVRAEDGRAIAGTDISNFIDGLPGGQDTRCFSTENASGSTSQAAAIVEALEVGARCLLLDEDTSATNFMIRDARMQRLVAREHEPITPFLDRVRALADDLGVSVVLVVGGSGDYFDVADTVIAMRAFRPEEVTARAREITRAMPSARGERPRPWRALRPRIPDPASIDPSRGRREVRIRAQREDRVQFGKEEVELAAVEPLVEVAQVRAVAGALVWARGRAIDGHRSLPEAFAIVMEAVAKGGLEALQDRPDGDLAGFRIHELAAFLNRLRSLRVR